jgi:hypothetical protein
LVAGFTAFLLAGAESLSGADSLSVCAGFSVAFLAGFLDFLLAGLLSAPDGAGSFAACADFAVGLCAGFFAEEEAEEAGLAVALSEVCPATGCATINKERRPAKPREASRERRAGEDETIILPL